jgi:hypothetical protein
MSKEHLLEELKLTENEAISLKNRASNNKLTKKDKKFLDKACEFIVWFMQEDDMDDDE